MPAWPITAIVSHVVIRFPVPMGQGEKKKKIIYFQPHAIALRFSTITSCASQLFITSFSLAEGFLWGCIQ